MNIIILLVGIMPSYLITAVLIPHECEHFSACIVHVSINSKTLKPKRRLWRDIYMRCHNCNREIYFDTWFLGDVKATDKYINNFELIKEEGYVQDSNPLYRELGLIKYKELAWLFSNYVMLEEIDADIYRATCDSGHHEDFETLEKADEYVDRHVSLGTECIYEIVHIPKDK